MTASATIQTAAVSHGDSTPREANHPTSAPAAAQNAASRSTNGTSAIGPKYHAHATSTP